MAVFTIVMLRSKSSPGCVWIMLGYSVMVRGSCIVIVLFLAVHMYVAAAAVPIIVPARMKTSMDMSYPAILMVMLRIVWFLEYVMGCR